MKVAGTAVVHAPVQQVWDALLDPAVLVRTIPGCERLEETGEHRYAMTVTAGVASIKGTYAGTCALSDLQEPESLVLHAEGAGGPGTVSADVKVGFKDLGDGTTEVGYDADAVVGGMVGGVGQRMLTSVSRRMAGEFFAAVDRAITEPAPAAGGDEAAGDAQAPAQPGVFTAPARAASGGPGLPQGDFLTGVLVGAGLVLAGVVVGGLVGRRR